MILTIKLLSHLNRVFQKEPKSFLALRFRYNGLMTWSVSDGVLTTAITGGIGSPLSVDLSGYTLTSLVTYLAARPGYSVEYADSANASLSAMVLLDGSGNQDASDGDHLYAYSTILYSYLESVATELKAAISQIVQMLRQLSTKTADGEWLDELGGYYGVTRLIGESSVVYGARIIAETIKPRGNGVAIELSLEAAFGVSATVTDVVVYGSGSAYLDGSRNLDGTHLLNGVSTIIYGLFDVSIPFNASLGLTLGEYTTAVTQHIQTVRDAGTQLRTLTVS